MQAHVKEKNKMSSAKSDCIEVKTENGVLRLIPFSEGILRVQQIVEGVGDFPASIVVNASPAHVKMEWSETGSGGKLSIAGMKVVLKDGRLSFFNETGDCFLEEAAAGRHVTSSAELPNEYQCEQSFKLKTDEAYYGWGQHQEGVMNYRGELLRLVQTNTDIVVPMMISNCGYGILWDNCSFTTVDSKTDPDVLKIDSEAGAGLDYYVIYGPEADDIIRRYRFLTGAAPMFPKWAYGYWQSKERYVDQEDILGVVAEYRERKIPLDVMVQDWRYWGELGWSSMRFDPDVFPDPEAMMREMHEQHHAHVMISIWPALGIKTPICDELQQQGLVFDDREHWAGAYIYDAYSEKARKTYWRYADEGIFSKGVDGWWMDGTEPEFVAQHTVESSLTGIKNNRDHSMGSWARYLNPYSMITCKGVYEGQRQKTAEKRVCILTRSGFAGQQRYAAMAWSGDIIASWQVFKNQISAGLNYCLSGLPYWTMDIGGFFTFGNGADFLKGCEDEAYRELYLRWFQYGAFCPVFRSHGTNTPREVWRFGEPGSPLYEALLKADHLRYRLMPYIYSLAADVTLNSGTIMRGLPMDFRKDPNVRAINDQFMFGESILVNPVTRPMYHKREKVAAIIDCGMLHNQKKERGGLDAQYFDDLDLKNCSVEKIDPTIDFDWSGGPPVGVSDSNYSVRWQGFVLSRESGEHLFQVACDGGVRLKINGKTIIDAWQHKGELATFKAPVMLKNEQENPITLEYRHYSDQATVRLSWMLPRSKDEYDELPEKKIRPVYLPAGSDWVNFYSGERINGGQTIEADAPLDIMPLFIKAGAILPLGPFIQYVDEKPANPIELRIYPGADGSFTLYEDEGDSYHYEDGVYSTIPIHWDDADRKVTFGERKGSFPGMLAERLFNITLSGTGLEETKNSRRVVYSGSELTVAIP